MLKLIFILWHLILLNQNILLGKRIDLKKDVSYKSTRESLNKINNKIKKTNNKNDPFFDVKPKYNQNQ